MKEEILSARQVCVLTVTGLLAPAAELLPGVLARGGGLGWAVPVLVLPVLLVWLALLGRLFREEGEGLFSLLDSCLGKRLGGGMILLYIMWDLWLLAEQVRRTAERMGSVYGVGGGVLSVLGVLTLSVWMVRGKRDALFRAGELFWLAMAITVAAVVLLALPQMRWEYLLSAPEGEGGGGALVRFLEVWGTTIFGTVLLPRVRREPGMGRRAAGWLAVSCLMAAALAASVIGHMGPRLTGRWPLPFLVMVQGLSLEGAILRLEGPVAALWLLADFCRMSLLLAVLRESEKETGRVRVAAGAAAAGIGAFLIRGEGTVPGGILLGICVPAVLFYISKGGKTTEAGTISCRVKGEKNIDMGTEKKMKKRGQVLE